MKTLDVACDGHRAAPCRSASSTRGPDDPMADRNERLPGAHERDLEILAYYRGRPQRISLTDVIYLRADQKYVCVHHLNGILLVDRSLCAFEHEFPDLLLRIHRNALVMRSRLVGLEKQSDGSIHAVLTDCDDRPAVSRRHLREVRGWLRERFDPDQT